MAGMLGVREFRTAQDMIAHAREVARRARVRDLGGKPEANWHKPAPVVEDAPKPKKPEPRVIDFWRTLSSPPIEIVGTPYHPSISFIIKCAADFFEVSAFDIKSERRQPPIVRARQAVCWVAKTITMASYPKIGMALGGRDHSTAHHAVHETERRRAMDDDWRRKTDEFLAFVKFSHANACAGGASE